jgi:hypothetical protein
LRIHHSGKRRHMRFLKEMYHASYVSEAWVASEHDFAILARRSDLKFEGG